MDEPLSGLDSVNARLVLEALHETVHGGGGGGDIEGGGGRPSASVLLSVHQPTHRFLKAMAGIVVMAPGGKLLYCGPRILADGRDALGAAFDAAAALCPGGAGCPPLLTLSPNPAEAMLEALADPAPAMVERVAKLVEIAEAERDRLASDGNHGQRRLSVAWRGAARGGLLRQVAALSTRHLTLMYRHPMLICINLVATALIGAVCALAFFHDPTGDAAPSSVDFNGDVLQRMGLIFFLGTYFVLTALAGLSLWHTDRLLYFQERGAGCYGPLAYLVSRTLFETVPMRVLPSVLCAAVVYPLVGLREDGPGHTLGQTDANGPVSAAAFVAALTLANLAGTMTMSCAGIVLKGTGVATFVGVLVSLYAMLFCGFLVNLPTLCGHGAAACALPQLSFLKYFIETTLVNELHDRTVVIRPIDPRFDPRKPVLVPGKTVLLQLGFDPGQDLCALGMPCSSWANLEVLAAWVAGGLLACYVLLRWGVTDPH